MGLLAEIIESLSRNRFRTAMTGFAVAWGIFILIVLLGASSGLEHGIHNSYGSQAANSLEVWTRWTSMPCQGLQAGRKLYFTEQEASLVRALPEVEHFSCQIDQQLTLSYRSQYSTLFVKGVESDYQKIMGKTLVMGRFINALDEQACAKVAVLDTRAVEELNTTNASLLGQYIQIGGINFKVVGICQTGDRWSGATAHIPFATHQAIFSPDKRFYDLVLTLQGVETMAQYKAFENKILDRLSASLHFDRSDTQAVGVWSQMEGYEMQSKTMAAIRLFIMIIALCTLVSGAVGVSNIMLVSVRERTKEIGIRKALGASPKNILLSIMGESLAITALFGYIGIWVGMGVVALVAKIVEKAGATGSEMGQIFVNPTVDIPSILVATLILIVVGLLAGFIPAKKAVSVQPIEAMNADK